LNARHASRLKEPFQPFVPERLDHGIIIARCAIRNKASSELSFDIPLWYEQGELTEFTRGFGGGIRQRLWTPPVECGLLPGTLRAELLDSGEVAERVIPQKRVA